MKKDFFIARYSKNGQKYTRAFNKTSFDEESAKQLLNAEGIQNFLFFFEPNEPVMFDENTIKFSGEVGWEITSDRIIDEVKAGRNLIIDTYGGDLYEGIKIYDSLRILGLNPSIGVIGTVASAGTIILLATSSDKRWMSENSRFLIHNAWTWEEGDSDQMLKTSNDLKNENLKLAKVYANETGGELNDMLTLMKDEKFLTAKETLALGFISEIKGNSNNTNINNNSDMNKDEIKEDVSIIQKTLNTISNKLGITKAEVSTKDTKNIMISDVNGAEIDFGADVTSVEEIAEGLTDVKIDGEIANGEFITSDGISYTFENGTLIEIKDTEQEEVATEDDTAEAKAETEALTVENDTLKTENSKLKETYASLQSEYDTLKTSQDEVKEEVKTLQTKLNEISNQFSDDKPAVTTPVNDNKQDAKPRVTFNLNKSNK